MLNAKAIAGFKSEFRGAVIEPAMPVMTMRAKSTTPLSTSARA